MQVLYFDRIYDVLKIQTNLRKKGDICKPSEEETYFLVYIEEDDNYYMHGFSWIPIGNCKLVKHA